MINLIFENRTVNFKCVVLLCFAPLSSLSNADYEIAGNKYWNAVSELCGKAFEGTLITAPAGDTSFEGQRLIMHVRSCSDNQIRIPFVVGDNLSRTWVLTRKGDRIELKHDHRHEDGSEDTVTMYGGTTTNAGISTAQYFPADEETRTIIPEAHSNVWTMRVQPGETFTYGLWRLGTPRVFQVDFDLGNAVEPPLAPWGWQD